MKKTIPLFKYIQYALMIIFGIIGANVASTTVYQYEIIVNGILGLAIFYLLYQVFIFLNKEWTEDDVIDNHTLFEFPKNIGSLLLTFLVASIVYWALMRIFDAFSFLFLGQ